MRLGENDLFAHVGIADALYVNFNLSVLFNCRFKVKIRFKLTSWNLAFRLIMDIYIYEITVAGRDCSLHCSVLSKLWNAFNVIAKIDVVRLWIRVYPVFTHGLDNLPDNTHRR